jgi:thymidylate synthase ThyX
MTDVEQEKIVTFRKNIAEEYEFRLLVGCKPEQARGCLPVETYTQFWMQGDYRAWLNFFLCRLHPEAQEETRLVAQAMWNLLREHQPEIVGTMADYLDEWTQDCNPIFTPARKKRAEWFRERFLKEVKQ